MHIGVSQPETWTWEGGETWSALPPGLQKESRPRKEQQEHTLQPRAAAQHPAGSSWPKLQNAQKRTIQPPLALQMLKQSPPLCVTKASPRAAKPVGLLQTSACRKAVSWAVLRPHGQC